MIKDLDIEHIKKEFKKIQNYFTTGNYEKVIEKTEILLNLFKINNREMSITEAI